MAAPLRCMTYCRLNFGRFLMLDAVSVNKTPTLQCSTEVNMDKVLEQQMKEEYEREVARLRDVSNLSSYAKSRHKGVYEERFLNSDQKRTRSRAFYRKMFAAYGTSSGLDPRKLWPSKEEMQSLIDDDKNWEPTFQEMVAKLQAEKEQYQKEAVLRDEKIEKAMANMDKLIKDYQRKLVQAAKEVKKTSDTNMRLLSEFRDRYGYSVPEKSYRFKEFKKERIEAQKRAKKLEKKQEKLDQRRRFEESLD